MSKNIKTNPFAFSPVLLDQDSHEKRRVIRNLPVVHQTETLQKFAGASMDHLFDPGKGKSINGYVGQKPLWYDPDQDYYLEETAGSRDFYQLEASMVSKNVEGQLTDFMPYADLINQLRYQGALVDNHDRMFSQDFYTWCPPIDLDKIVNFRQYVWMTLDDLQQLGGDLGAHRISGPTVVRKATGSQTSFKLPGFGTGDDLDIRKFYDLSVLSSSLMRVKVDGVVAQFSYVGGQNQLSFSSPPALDAEVSISIYSDLENNAIGLRETSELAFSGIKLSSGMRIVADLDRTSDFTGVFIVEGVGESIRLIPESSTVATSPDYITMARGASDRNEWSMGNRWFHSSTLPESMAADFVQERRATRPIIEFHANLELFNYGTSRRLDVDLVVEDIEDLTGYLNQHSSSAILSGVNVTASGEQLVADGQVRSSMRLLVRGTINSLLNDRVLVLLSRGGVLKMILETDGRDPSGSPFLGEVVRVNSGVRSGENLYWNGSRWVTSQGKTRTNQAPLFQLYDLDGQSLSDQGLYPGSSFSGSRLFGYKVDTTSARPVDQVLDLSLVHDDKGQILFENFLGTERHTYSIQGKSHDIQGFYFHLTGDQLSNDWYKGPDKTRQNVVDKFISDGRTKLFTLSQETQALSVVRGRVSESKSFERTQLVEDRDFIRVGREIMIIDVKQGDVIEARSLSDAGSSDTLQGYYEVPLNLQANPNNDQVASMTKGDFYDHFSEIMRSQDGFSGAEYAANSYRDTSKRPNLGTHIIQHSSGLLKTMLLASQSQLDVTAAIRYVEGEYLRFKDKFQQKILEFSRTRRFGANVSHDTWIATALEEINKGKTKRFPFYLSDMARSSTRDLPSFIPPTPSSLGLYPLFAPEMISQEVDGADAVWFVRGHDGSLMRAETQTCATIMLALESKIQESVSSLIRQRERPLCDYLTAHGDQYRTGDYSYDEYLSLLRPSFERWCVSSGQDYRTNESFDAKDPWTWNWSAKGLPGHWRGIYEKFFGTQRPDLTPWESLGFSTKPSWWEGRYGPAPYTSENLILWNDLEQGYIHLGSRRGINANLARPGLTLSVPVDAKGRLRHPGPRKLIAYDGGGDIAYVAGDPETWEDTHDDGVLGCGVCDILPLVQERSSSWKFGDMGPVEQMWRRSSSLAFAVSTATYLMKPCQFIELGWNTKETNIYFKGTSSEQFLSQDTKGRPRHSDLSVHGETLDDLTQVSKTGVQQWISDYLASSGTDIKTAFADKVRGLGVQLSYKVAGFTDDTTLVVVSDAFGRVPSEDVAVSLYRSPSIREESYSGVAIENTGRGYVIYGYDSLNPYFPILPPSQSGSSISVGSGTKTSVPVWRSGVYYAVGFTLRHEDLFYSALKSHTSSSFFEEGFWTRVEKPRYADGTSLTWFLDGEIEAHAERVNYGTLLRTPQEVANFLNGYQRYLEGRGWIFDDIQDGDARDWRAALASFILWSSRDDREVGDYLTLSPSSSILRFKTTHGTIQPVERITNGFYSIVDQDGQPIDDQKTRVVRNDGDITIRCDDDNRGIFGLRLFVSEVEHALIFNNQTIFGDVIYSPLLNIKQARLRLQGFKTVGWRGRIDAPGFIVTGNSLTPNFERAADDFRRFFDIEGMENKSLQDRARANFGYEEKDYLNNLLLTPTNQFEFYQGMIQQKGSTTAMRRLLRSNFIRHNKGLKLFEEWAFRVGDYGGQDSAPQLNIQIRQSEFKHNPQLIQFTDSVSEDSFGIIDVLDTNVGSEDSQLDPRWHWRPNIKKISWPLTEDVVDVLPTAGYVKLDEVRFTTPTHQSLLELFGTSQDSAEPLIPGDRVWVYGMGEGDISGSWETYKFANTGYSMISSFASTHSDQGAVVQIDRDSFANPGGTVMMRELSGSDISPLGTYVSKTTGSAALDLTYRSNTQNYVMGLLASPRQVITSIRVTVSKPFALGSTLNLGHEDDLDLFSAMGSQVNLNLAGVYEVSASAWEAEVMADDSHNFIASLYSAGSQGALTVRVEYRFDRGFEIFQDINGDVIPVTSSVGGGTAELFTWLGCHYETLSQASTHHVEGDIIEVDSSHDDPSRWAVYTRSGGQWHVVRRQNRRVDSNLISSAAIFNSRENKLKLVLQLYDPVKGFIPGAADRELDYKTVLDPAVYDDGLLVWGREQVNRLWWDLSAVRYLDYEIYDGWTDAGHVGVDYRWKNWGRIAPNSSVDIYQWTRSPVSPVSWSDYVASRSNMRTDDRPTGTVAGDTHFVSSMEWNDDLQADELVYYFWVKNPSVTPTTPSRKLSAQQISGMLSNPTSNDLPMFAVIDVNKVIIGGIRQFLNETDTVLKVRWTETSEALANHHKQWLMLREEDERNTIDDRLWSKMRDSLVGWDSTGKSVPDPRLPATQRLGALIRPRQSWYPTDLDASGVARPSRGARAALVDVINDIMAKQPFMDQWYDWKEIFESGESEPNQSDYVAKALDLADLDNLLPASKNMVEVGEKVLVSNTSEVSGFWTLWKLVERSGVRTFILDNFQSWRLTEGELWSPADWYASGWSAKNFPNYRFTSHEARDAAGNLDVTLLRGTLVQIDRQSSSDDRWSWDVYTSSSKYQVAKARSTIKISDILSDDSRITMGPALIQEILGTNENLRITPGRIQELANVINYRDGSREIEFLLDSLRTRLFDTLQKNQLFFGMVKSAFNQSQVVDWAFKTSFLYLGGYSETLRQSPVAFKDQIDNVISYLDEVKPYHVKIREYVRRLSHGPDLANLAITDFDKPVYPEGSTNRILDINNPTDKAIMEINRPWRDWLNAHEKPVGLVGDWDADWNGVRRSSVKIKIDRVSCGTIRGWNVSPWDPSLLVHSQLTGSSKSLSQLSALYRTANTQGQANFYRDQAVETIDDRNLLVRRGVVSAGRPGSIVTVLQTGENFMWTGATWVVFGAVGWAEDPNMGAAGRIEASYRPTLDMPRRDDPGLIEGCDFDGTIITDTFQYDGWDIFNWDSTGYSQGIRERAGMDQDGVSGDTTPQVEAQPGYIGVTGNTFSQPSVNGSRPSELVQIRGLESLIINVKKSTGLYQKSFMNSLNRWEDVAASPNTAVFQSWDQTARTLSLSLSAWTEDANGYTTIHDPQNPSTGFIRDIMASSGYRSTSNVDMTTQGTKTFKLRAASDVTQIPPGLRGDDVRVAVVNTKNPSQRAIGVLSQSKGSEKNWNGEIVVTFTDGFKNIGTGKNWNIIPVDIFNEPGVIWIGDARFTYTEVQRGPVTILKNVRLSGTSLGCLNVGTSGVTLRSTGPVVDGSRHRRRG